MFRHIGAALRNSARHRHGIFDDETMDSKEPNGIFVRLGHAFQGKHRVQTPCPMLAQLLQ
jgi:hypothetical protein